MRELAELCLHNKPEERPEISIVCAKLKELKVTIEQQVPFATYNNYKLFTEAQAMNVQNKKLKDTVVQLEAVIAQLEASAHKQNQKKDLLIEEKDQQIQEKAKKIQEKDQQIEKLQLLNIMVCIASWLNYSLVNVAIRGNYGSKDL